MATMEQLEKRISNQEDEIRIYKYILGLNIKEDREWYYGRCLECGELNLSEYHIVDCFNCETIIPNPSSLVIKVGDGKSIVETHFHIKGTIMEM